MKVVEMSTHAHSSHKTRRPEKARTRIDKMWGIFLNFFDSFFRFHFHAISPNSSPSHLSVLLSSLIRCDAFGASFLFLYLVSSFFSPLLAMSALPSLFIDSPPSSFFVFTFVVAIQMYFNLKIERNSRFPLLVFRFLARFWLLHPRNLI